MSLQPQRYPRSNDSPSTKRWARPHVRPPLTYAAQAEATSPKFARAFALGCGGHACPDLSHLRDGGFAAFCTPSTWGLLRQAQAEGRDWYYGDHAFFRRFKYYRIAKNAYQWQGPIWDVSPTRFHNLHLDHVAEWQDGGTAIVICPNSPEYMAFHGIDAKRWALDIAETVSQHSDRPVIIRWKSGAAKRPLYVDLHTAYMVIVYSSAAAVEALLHGIPICTLAPWATTASMGITDVTKIETPFRPSNRLQFLYTLAHLQWSLEEIERGDAWRALHTPPIDFRRG